MTQKQIKIKLLARTGAAALVNWTDETGTVRRAVVPKSEVVLGHVSSKILEMSIPLDGVDLVSELETDTLSISVKDLQNKLRSAGVYTPQDYLEKPEVISGVLQKLYGLDVATIQNLVAHI